MTPLRKLIHKTLAEDPYGELSDLAIAAELGCAEATVSAFRRWAGWPSAQERRRTKPGARVAHCDCGKSYTPSPGRNTVLCLGCGVRVRAITVK